MSEPRPVFSICHASARPTKWQPSCKAWMDNARYPEAVEYILAIHESQLSEFQPTSDVGLVVNSARRRCSVDGWNAAARASLGDILILNSDDMFPPYHWDWNLLEHIENVTDEFVIETTSATDADAHRLMVLQILSRARYRRLGYALYPRYESVFCDNDFTAHARHDGVVIDARNLVFEHRHPSASDLAQWDEVYAHENRPEAYELGRALFEERKACQFQK